MRYSVIQRWYPLGDRFQLDAPRRHLNGVYGGIGFGNRLDA